MAKAQKLRFKRKRPSFGEGSPPNFQIMLSQAVIDGDEKEVERLLKQEGVDPDAKDCDDRTPLSHAAGNGKQAVVHLLLKQRGVTADFKDSRNRTPLSWAAEAGHKAVIRLLLKQNSVDPESVDYDGLTPLSRAAEHGHDASAELLIERDRSTLHVLAKEGHLAPLQFLIKMGYDINVQDIYGRTPLHTAVSSNNFEIAKELVAKNASVDCRDINGLTPLRVAIQHKRKDFADLLLKHSAQTKDIMSKDWLVAYHRDTADVILELSQLSSGRKFMQFNQEHIIKMSDTPKSTKRLL
jgi:ankyrin repeat protein